MNKALLELIRIIKHKDHEGLQNFCIRFGSDAWVHDLARRALIDVETLDDMLVRMHYSPEQLKEETR